MCRFGVSKPAGYPTFYRYEVNPICEVVYAGEYSAVWRFTKGDRSWYLATLDRYLGTFIPAF